MLRAPSALSTASCKRHCQYKDMVYGALHHSNSLKGLSVLSTAQAGDHGLNGSKPVQLLMYALSHCCYPGLLHQCKGSATVGVTSFCACLTAAVSGRPAQLHACSLLRSSANCQASADVGAHPKLLSPSSGTVFPFSAYLTKNSSFNLSKKALGMVRPVASSVTTM